MNGQLPHPPVQAFLLCNEILHDARTDQFVLVGPVTYVPATEFPVGVRLSVYLQVTGGHGRYALEFELRDCDGETYWRWQPGGLEHPDPVFPHKVAFHDLVLDIPQAGRYDLVLRANGEDLASQGLWVGPREVFLRGLDAEPDR